jgi:Leucine-rich repeat (LRR) protein
LKLVMQCSNTQGGPTTATLKNLVITAHTEEIDLPHCDLTDDDLSSIKDFHSIRSLIVG